mgnify:CR=1 FL=1
MQRAARIPIAGVHSPVYHVSDTSSTLDLAATLLADTTTPTPHLTTIIADRQSAGRGRLGRTWTTPDGQALLASTIVSLPTSFPTKMLGWLVHACALSVRDALSPRLTPVGHTVSLKWPNDVLVDGARKICGILAQLAPASSPFTTSAILGYGINVAQRPDNLATEQATSLYAEGDDEAAQATTAVMRVILADVLSGIEKRVRALIAHGNAHDSGLAEEAASALALLGQRIALAEPTDPSGRVALEGVALALTSSGSLLVRTDDGRTHDINAGDVLTTGIPLTTAHDTKEKRANN